MLPFIAGIAAGAIAVVAVNNKKEIKNQVTKSAKKFKETAKDVKKAVEKKVDCLSSKKEDKKVTEVEE